MPLRALGVVTDAQTFAMEELGALLVRHCRETAPEPPPVPESLAIEARLSEQPMSYEDWGAVRGQPTSFTCPECKGPIHEIREAGLTRFRCRVGHAYSSFDLLGDKGKAVEDALWMALQTLEERAEMLERLASDDRQHSRHRGAGSFADRARETRAHADRLRELLVTVSV